MAEATRICKFASGGSELTANGLTRHEVLPLPSGSGRASKMSEGEGESEVAIFARAPNPLSPTFSPTGRQSSEDSSRDRCTLPVRPLRLRQLGNQLCVFGLRPRSYGAGAHIALRADRHAELGDIRAVWSLDDRQEIGFARGHIGLLDFEAELFGRFARRGGALRRLLDVADALLRPIHGDQESWHDHFLPGYETRQRQRIGAG